MTSQTSLVTVHPEQSVNLAIESSACTSFEQPHKRPSPVHLQRVQASQMPKTKHPSGNPSIPPLAKGGEGGFGRGCHRDIPRAFRQRGEAKLSRSARARVRHQPRRAHRPLVMRILPILLLALPGTTLADASPRHADYYVATDGKDDNPGTFDHPFATLERARNAVRRNIAKGLKHDVLVYLRGGRYWVRKPIVFGPEDSGTRGHRITYAAYPGESPVISGGMVLPLFTDHGDGVWAAPLPKEAVTDAPPRELFVNNRRATRARLPNRGYFRVDAVGPDKRSSFTYAGHDLDSIRDADNMELVFLHDWSISRQRVQSINHATRTLTLRYPLGRSMDRFEPHPRYFLENARAFLDSPGEWYADRHLVYYVPQKAQVLDRTQAIVPVAHQLLVLRGDVRKQRPLRNLTFKGLTFQHARWDLPPHGYTGIQAGFFDNPDEGRGEATTDALSPAIEATFADTCRFEGLRIEHVGGSGIWFGRQTTGSGLFNSTVDDVAGNGVMIGEDSSRWIGRRPTVSPSLPRQLNPKPQPATNVAELQAQLQRLLERYTPNHPDVIAIKQELAALGINEASSSRQAASRSRKHRPTNGPWWQVAPSQAASGNRIEHTTIHSVGRVFHGAVGVWIGLANHTTVASNVIDDLPYTGISVGWMWNQTPTPAHDNLIQANYIHDVMLRLSDGGAIYTLGRQPGTLVRANIIQSIPKSSGVSESNGIFIDEGSSYLRFESNAISGVAQSPFRLHRAAHVALYNNVISVSAGQVAYRYNDTDPGTIDKVGNRVH